MLLFLLNCYSINTNNYKYKKANLLLYIQLYKNKKNKECSLIDTTILI